jgi:hypothetical protein
MFLTYACLFFLGVGFSIMAKTAIKNESVEARRLSVFISIIFLVLGLLFLILVFNENEIKGTQERARAEEKTLHSNLLTLPEGRYILDEFISVDSAKVHFTLRLPGIAKRKVEVIAYDNHPSKYWNEWQAEGSAPGDTLLIRDTWNSDSSYDREVQRMGEAQIGFGYVTFDWILSPEWIEIQKRGGGK